MVVGQVLALELTAFVVPVVTPIATAIAIVVLVRETAPHCITPRGRARVRVAATGTNAEGGEFESVFVGLSLYRGARLVGVELFELEDLDAARARFQELCAARTT